MRVIKSQDEWNGVEVGDIAKIAGRIDVVFTTNEEGRLVDDVLHDKPVDLGAALAYAAELRKQYGL